MQFCFNLCLKKKQYWQYNQIITINFIISDQCVENSIKYYHQI